MSIHLSSDDGHVSATSRPVTAEQIQEWMVKLLAEHLQVSPDTIDIAAPFESLGIDSLAAVGVTGELEDWLGRTVDPMTVYNYPSVEQMAEYLAGDR